MLTIMSKSMGTKLIPVARNVPHAILWKFSRIRYDTRVQLLSFPVKEFVSSVTLSSRTSKDTTHREIRGDPVVSTGIYDYRLRMTKLDEDVKALRSETAEVQGAGMASTSDSLAMMKVLVMLLNAKRVVDIGMFTGLSALTFAKACADDGKVFTIDRSDKHLPLAQKHWTAASVSHKIQSKIGNALQILNELHEVYGDHSFDAGYIDADKSSYDAYYEKLLLMVRPGGLILVDNLLWYGRVLDTEEPAASTIAIRTMTEKLSNDDRVDFVLLECGDGLGVCYVRP